MTMSAASAPNPLQGLADTLHALGAGIGADTPLGSWLMSDSALPVTLGVAALLILLALAVLLTRRRRRQAADRSDTAATVAPVEPVLGGEPGRTHPEALAMLYDAPSRREPVLSSAPAEPVAATVSVPARPVPETAAPVPDVAVAGPVPVARENASLKLMVSAVDRLLQRVESQQSQIRALLDELKAQSSALVVQGERLLALEARVAALSGGGAVAPAVTAGQPAGDMLPALEQAIALAARGADEQELVSQLGLSAAEARLINLVHGQAGADAASAGVAR